MFGSKAKASSSRRLGVARDNAGAPAPQQASQHPLGVPPRNSHAALDPSRHADHATAPVHRIPTANAATGRPSKAQALAAFHSAVEGASRVRVGSAQPAAADPQSNPEDPSSTPNNPAQQQAGPAAQAEQPAAATAHQPHPAAAAQHARGLSTAGANPLLQHSHHQQKQQPIPPTRPPAEPAAAASQLLPRASKALSKLQQQLASRTLTYHYQFDGLLQGARDALAALVAQLSGSTAAAEPAALLQLLAPGQDAAAAADALLGICNMCWEVCSLLLQHHHAAEPQNTAHQAAQFQDAARVIWEVCEIIHASSTAAAAAEAEEDDSREADGGSWQLTDALVTSLSGLVQAASSWAAAGDTAAADWCYLQLRKHLCSISRAGQDPRLQLGVRQALQQLQFQILQGSIGMAARQGHQALWANLTSMLQQLLASTVLDVEDAISMCLSLSGSLAEQAASSSSSSRASAGREAAGTSEGGAGGGVAAAAAAGSAGDGAGGVDGHEVMLLEFAAELLEYSRQQVAALQQQQQWPDGNTQEMPVVQHISGIQQQVLLQLGQAYLADRQHVHALDCVNTLQGLSTGHTPIPGLVQLSSLALLGQGKLSPATAQLCAWLKQGGQAAEEACAAVDAFLQALHRVQGLAGGVMEGVVQQVASAAVERCSGDTSVAVAVAIRLMAIEGSSSHHSSLEQLVVQLLAVEEVAQRLLQHPKDCQRCHALLHQRGQAHYEALSYTTAIQLLTPAVFFSTTVTVGKSARLLAMSLIKAQQPQKALQYIGLAEQQEGRCTALGCLIRLQALLGMKQQQRQPAELTSAAAAAAAAGVAASNGGAAAGAGPGLGVGSEAGQEEEAACIAAVKNLSICSDIDDSSVQAAFCLCMQAGSSAAAWQLLKCWSSTPAAATAGKGAAGDKKAFKGQKLIQVLSLMYNMFRQQNSSSSTAPVLTSRLTDMCGIHCSCIGLHMAAAGAADVPARFTHQQLMWLADVGLHLGVSAAHAGLWDPCLKVLKAVAACCTSIQPASDNKQRQQKGAAAPHLSPVALASVCLRHVAAVASAVPLLLRAHAVQPAQLLHLQHAKQLLGTAQQQLLALQQLQASDPAALEQAAAAAAYTADGAVGAAFAATAAPITDSLSSPNPSNPQGCVVAALQHLVIQLGFAVACREKQEPEMKQWLQQLVQHPATTPADLQAAARECLQPNQPWRNEGIATLAYGFMLRVAAGASSPDAAAVSDAVVGVMALVSSHAVKVKVCQKVVEVLATLQQQQQQQQQCVQGQVQGQKAAASAVAVPGLAGYPAHKLQWLIATCWNTAVELRASNAAAAQQYLDCAAKLAAYQKATPSGNSSRQQQQQCLEGEQQIEQEQHWLLGSKQFKALRVLLAAQQARKGSGEAAEKAAASSDTDAAGTGAGAAADYTAGKDSAAAAAAAGQRAAADCATGKEGATAAAVHAAQQGQSQPEKTTQESSQQPAANTEHAAAAEPPVTADHASAAVGSGTAAVAAADKPLCAGVVHRAARGCSPNPVAAAAQPSLAVTHGPPASISDIHQQQRADGVEQEDVQHEQEQQQHQGEEQLSTPTDQLMTASCCKPPDAPVVVPRHPALPAAAAVAPAAVPAAAAAAVPAAAGGVDSQGHNEESMPHHGCSPGSSSQQQQHRSAGPAGEASGGHGAADDCAATEAEAPGTAQPPTQQQQEEQQQQQQQQQEAQQLGTQRPGCMADDGVLAAAAIDCTDGMAPVASGSVMMVPCSPVAVASQGDMAPAWQEQQGSQVVLLLQQQGTEEQGRHGLREQQTQLASLGAADESTAAAASAAPPAAGGLAVAAAAASMHATVPLPAAHDAAAGSVSAAATAASKGEGAAAMAAGSEVAAAATAAKPATAAASNEVEAAAAIAAATTVPAAAGSNGAAPMDEEDAPGLEPMAAAPPWETATPLAEEQPGRDASQPDVTGQQQRATQQQQQQQGGERVGPDIQPPCVAAVGGAVGGDATAAAAAAAAAGACVVAASHSLHTQPQLHLQFSHQQQQQQQPPSTDEQLEQPDSAISQPQLKQDESGCGGVQQVAEGFGVSSADAAAMLADVPAAVDASAGSRPEVHAAGNAAAAAVPQPADVAARSPSTVCGTGCEGCPRGTPSSTAEGAAAAWHHHRQLGGSSGGSGGMDARSQSECEEDGLQQLFVAGDGDAPSQWLNLVLSDSSQ